MMKAAEDLKQQQMLKEQERQRVLQERIIPLPDLDDTDSGQIFSRFFHCYSWAFLENACLIFPASTCRPRLAEIIQGLHL